MVHTVSIRTFPYTSPIAIHNFTIGQAVVHIYTYQQQRMHRTAAVMTNSPWSLGTEK